MIPDKIYIGAATLSSNSPSEEYLLPDWHLRPNPKIANVEYIRKDALLEWAEDVKAKTGWYEIEVAMDDLIDKLNSM